METSKSNIGIVILSRYNSSRLPGKALKTINGKEILTYIIERLCRVVSKGDIVIATSDRQTDAPIVAYCEANNIQVYRGSLDNVALRFFEAASCFNMDYAVRVNGDNIFLDVNVFAEMMAIATSGNYDFISNVKNRTFPKGMSIEVIRTAFYKSLLPNILSAAEYYEHVTSFIYQNLSLGDYRFYYNEKLPEAAGIQMALDTEEDFERTKFIIDKFKEEHWHYNLKEIFELYKSYEKS